MRETYDDTFVKDPFYNFISLGSFTGFPFTITFSVLRFDFRRFFFFILVYGGLLTSDT